MKSLNKYLRIARGRPLHGASADHLPGEPRANDPNVSKTRAVAVICLILLPVSLAAKPPLRDVKEIDDALYYIAIANEISDYCDSISGRRLKAIGVMWGLRSKANKLGYSDTEIRAYVESDAEKNRMRAKGEAYLAENGVSYDKPNSFCALGRTEIERNSAIGVYLRAN